MGLAMAGVAHQPLKVRLVDELVEQGFPNAAITPAAEAPVSVFPIAISAWQISPRGAGSQNPQHGIDELAIVLGDAAPLSGLAGQMRFQQRPVSI